MNINSRKKTYGIFTTFLLHLHPQMIDKRAIKFSRTFGLGGINALLFIILAITGIWLRFSYLPSPEQAYDSILNLQNHTLLGSMIRNLHHWSAQLMVITAFLHLLRVFFTQSIYFERKRNWYYGLLLFLLVLAFNFTGYLLPWDQLSYWAVTVVTNMPSYIPFVGDNIAYFLRGGEQVDGNTLLNFYNLHTAIFPLLFVIFMSLHFYLVRKAKGVTVAPSEEKQMLKVNPNLIIREALVALILLVVLLIFAMVFSAPLLEYANPLLSPNPIKAPWYFAGMQELLIHVHPLMAVLVIPILITSFFMWIPRVQINKDNIGAWFYNKRGGKLLLISSISSAIITFVLILLFDFFIRPISFQWSPLLSSLLSFVIYFLSMFTLWFVLNKKYKMDKLENIHFVFSLIVSSYIMMSLIGIYLRGINMELIF